MGGMGFWSRVKSFTRSFVRQVVRIVIEAVQRFNPITAVPNLWMGVAGWPTRKLRLHVVVLADETGSVIKKEDVDSWQSLLDSVNYVVTTFKAELNVKVVPYTSTFIEVMKTPAPLSALDVTCDVDGYGAEFGKRGDFFAAHLAGWNAFPISLTFPVTVFVVRTSTPTHGCSFGPLTDYVTVDPTAISSISTMAHEIGHACGLPHWFASERNLMYAKHTRGSRLTWLQRMIVNSSRHVRLF